MLEIVLSAAFAASTIRLTAPLLLAALGGLCSERAGVVNIALEGLMICGACGGALAAAYWENPWLGFAVAALCGAALALVHAVASISLELDQIVSGTAINVLALGAPAVVVHALNPAGGAAVHVPVTFGPVAVPWLGTLPWAGEALFHHALPIYATFLAAALLWYALAHTAWGLRLRAVGEAPEAVDLAGVSVARLRYTGVILSGVAAGLAGGLLVLALSSQYVRDIAAGRGFMALAALVFGRWRPLGVLGACLLFGASQALHFRLQGLELIPAQWVQLLPYVVTLGVLLLWRSRTQPPAGLGRPYRRGARGSV